MKLQGSRMVMRVAQEQKGIETELRILERMTILLKDKYQSNKEFLEAVESIR